MSEQKKFVPFVSSETRMAEFTIRALIIGLVLAVILGAANAYLGLKAGMTIAATYPAAVIGMAILRALKGSILEENFTRTVGSIGESVAAGAIFTLPAFFISGIWKEFFTPGHYLISSLIMLTGGILGIMFVALLRRVMVEDAELPFPESVAAAEIHKAGRGKGTGSVWLFFAMIIGAVVKTLGEFKFFAQVWEKFVAFGSKTIGLNSVGSSATTKGGLLLGSPGLQPAYFGVGYIIGPKLASLNFSGGVIAWGLLTPIILYFIAPYLNINGLVETLRASGMGEAEATQAAWSTAAKDVWATIVRPIAIGGMLVGTIYTLWMMRKSLIAGIARSISDVKKAATGTSTTARIDKDISFTWIMVGILAAAFATFLITMFVFSTPFHVALVASLIMIIAGFFFGAVSGYLVGIIGSSNNPISGLTISTVVVTALLMSVLGVGPEGIAATLGVAAIVCVSAAVAGEMLQDLKAGHILGGTPWRMQVGDILGVLFSSAILFVPLFILHEGDISKQVNQQIETLKDNNITQVEYRGSNPDLGGKVYTLSELEKMTKSEQNEVLGLQAGFGSEELPAPQASLMAILSEGIVGGEMAWPLIIVGMLMGVGFILMQVKSPMLVSIGMYLPLKTTFAIFVGGIIKGILQMIQTKRGHNEAQRSRSENIGILLAAGLIAGEALIGLLFAGFAFFEVKIWNFSHPTYLVSLAILGLLALLMIRVPLKRAGKPDEPAPPTAG